MIICSLWIQDFNILELRIFLWKKSEGIYWQEENCKSDMSYQKRMLGSVPSSPQPTQVSIQRQQLKEEEKTQTILNHFSGEQENKS